MLERVSRSDTRPGRQVRVLVPGRAPQQGPARGDHHGPSADLHDRNGDSEKREDVRPDEVRPDEQEEAVHRDSPRELPARVRGIALRLGEEDRASAGRIHDREERADDEEDLFGDLGEHVFLCLPFGRRYSAPAFLHEPVARTCQVVLHHRVVVLRPYRPTSFQDDLV